MTRQRRTKRFDKTNYLTIFKDTLDRTEKSKDSIIYYEEDIITNLSEESEIIFEKNDCITVALRESYSGKVCLLNNASDLCPGGNVTKKNGSQRDRYCHKTKLYKNLNEGDICRRTNLYKNIIDHKNLYYFDILDKNCAKNNLIPQFKYLNYQIMLELENYKPFALFSPEISIIKDENYELIKEQKNISVITYAPIRNPVFLNGEYDEYHYNIMDKKIKMLLFIAKENNIDTLILVAWGCVGFNNPIHQVAKLFKENLKNTYFKKVIFAINDEYMLEKFKTEFNSD